MVWSEKDHPRGPDGKFAGISVGELHVPLKSGKMFHPEGSSFYQTTAPTSQLTDADREAVKNYAWDGRSFEKINRTLRSDSSGSVDADTEKGVRDLTKVINKHALRKPIMVHRGVPDTPQQRKLFRKGGTFIDHGFMSTSTDRDVADLMSDPTDEGGGIRMEIRLPTGTKAVVINDLFDTDGGFNQNEVLLQRGSKFKVDNMQQTGGVLNVSLSLVQQIDPTKIRSEKLLGWLSTRARWSEKDHPRGPNGKFGNKGAVIDQPSVDQIDVGDRIYQSKKGRWVDVVGKTGTTLTVRLPNGAVVPAAKADKVEKGGAEHAPPPHIESVRRSVKAFTDSGGTVQSSADPIAAGHDLDSQIAAMLDTNPDFPYDDGVLFTNAAIEHTREQGKTSFGVDVEGPIFLITARVPGIGIVGAMSVERRKNEIWVEYAGSTGAVKGAGSAMAKELARLSNALNLPVSGHPADKSAKAFWEKIGWTGRGGSMGWTPQQAGEVARA